MSKLDLTIRSDHDETSNIGLLVSVTTTFSLKPVEVELQLKIFKAKNDKSKVDYCKADNNVYFKLLGVIVEKHRVFFL